MNQREARLHARWLVASWTKGTMEVGAQLSVPVGGADLGSYASVLREIRLGSPDDARVRCALFALIEDLYARCEPVALDRVELEP